MKQGSEAERARQNGKPGRSDLSKARGLVRGLFCNYNGTRP